MMKKYAMVVVGGTFDAIHAGHEAILAKAFDIGERVIVALTSDRYVHAFKVHSPEKSGTRNSKFKIQTYKKREKSLHNWLLKKKFSGRFTIVPIDTPYEPAVSTNVHTFRPVDPALIDAIVVSEKTKDRAREINALRMQAGLKPLAVVVVPMVNAEDGTLVSSSRVRNGEIDTKGKLIMPENLRETLKKPLGPVFSGIKLDRLLRQFQDSGNPLDSRNRILNRMLITVGDVTTKTFLDRGVVPNLAIIDRKVERKPYDDCYQLLKDLDTVTVKSGPGFISKEAVDAIVRALHKVIIVEGEEDLLVLPVILHAPGGSVVYYGQPGEGMVEVRVTDGIRKKIRRLLARFI